LTIRTIRKVAHLPRQPRTPGFAMAQLHPELIDGGFDPFLQIDAFALAEPVFKPHPHAGFSAVTYILPESPIGFINRDSLGGRVLIPPGALHWTTAGSGLHHEEVPEQRGVAALGLQMFIDLPGALRGVEPGWLHLDPGDVPHTNDNGADVRVVLGASYAVASPLSPPTPGVFLIDVKLDAGATFVHNIDPAANAFLYMLDGSICGDPMLSPFDLAARA
jgi:redox-sensitive bicupin YhaK (pirin superfamily)